MTMFKQEMKPDEQAMMALRDLYSSYGYQHYKVSKFESYDLYVQNKNFLQSKRILTFTDTNGRLMALKPDVTLSIIKNTKPTAGMSKVYYTENVYRVPKNADGYQEIMQTGLELIGTVDDYAMAEVLMLAERSLRTISEAYVLDISHIGVLSGLLDSQELDEAQRGEIMVAVGERNLHQLRTLCARYDLSAQFSDTLCAIVSLYGPLEEALSQAEALALPETCRDAISSLRRLSNLLSMTDCRNLRLDLSLINDMDYYNGLVFRGFISGIAAGVLSGGRYDNLMAKMGREQSAIGFALYMDQLERYFARKEEYDVDILLSYCDGCDLAALIRKANELTREGYSVRVQPEGVDGVHARKRFLFKGSEVTELD